MKKSGEKAPLVTNKEAKTTDPKDPDEQTPLNKGVYFYQIRINRKSNIIILKRFPCWWNLNWPRVAIGTNFAAAEMIRYELLRLCLYDWLQSFINDDDNW